MPLEEVPIRGFILYHRPYNSDQEYSSQPLMGSGLTQHTLRELRPGTHYSIKLQAFNDQGQSPFSNSVVKRTRGTATV